MFQQLLRDMLRRDPFEPFTVTTTDGRTFAITTPRQMLVTSQTVVIGLPGPLGENETFVIRDRSQIASAEPDDFAPHIVSSV